MPGPSVGAFLLPWFGGAGLGSGGEVYIGAEGLREDCYCIGDRRGKGESAQNMVHIAL